MKIIKFALFFISVLICKTSLAVNIIRDSEIEYVLKQIIEPIALAANLDKDAIKLYIVNDNKVNAFVAGGANIFINSGLLTELADPDMVAGVIAHEMGHISEGHIARTHQIRDMHNKFMLSSALLGMGAMVAGNADLGLSMIVGGAHIAERGVLKYSREFETAADQAAMKFLHNSYGSSIGLLKSFEYFAEKEKAIANHINPYLVTHPLSNQRVKSAKEYSQKFPSNETTIDTTLRKNFDRVIIKLKSFTLKPETILKLYKLNDINSSYAQAIAKYRLGETKEAFKIIDRIIDNEKDNSYLYELKAQIAYEFGYIEDSINYYNKAISLNSNSLIKLGLAISYTTLHEKNSDKNFLEKAKNLLESCKEEDQENNLIYRQLAIVYGKLNDFGMANFYLAEEALIKGETNQAKYFAEKAKEFFPKDSKYLFKLNDILETSILQK
ncbi:MAG: M48 family metalloprotease [Alphaproteobacteria bacterium]